MDGGGRAGVDVVNHSNFPSSVVSVSKPLDVPTSGGRFMSEEAMIGLEGGGEDDNNLGSAIRPRGSAGASGSSTSLLGFGSEFIELSSSSSSSRSITTLLATEEDEDFRIGGDLWLFRKGLIVLKRLGSFLGVTPSIFPSGVNSGDSEAARTLPRFVGVRLGELFLLRLVGVLSTRSLEREASGLELNMRGEEEATRGKSATDCPVPGFLGVMG